MCGIALLVNTAGAAMGCIGAVSCFGLFASFYLALWPNQPGLEINRTYSDLSIRLLTTPDSTPTGQPDLTERQYSRYLAFQQTRTRKAKPLTEGTAVIVGGLIGAVAGLAGGGFAALASLRASQLAARTPLGLVLREISNTIISMNVTKGQPEYLKHRRRFERKWHEFVIQQRILCPSERIGNLMALVLQVGRNESDPPEALLNLAGQTLEKVTQMVSAHSNTLFRFRARRQEARIIQRWLTSKDAELLSEPVRANLRRSM
jgi:hypothetical protein